MLMKKLSEDHYIVVDDSDIKIGDIVAEKLLTGKYELFTIHTLNDIDEQTQIKITHSTQPEFFGTGWMKSIQPLFLSEVKELLGVVDVEKRAEEKIPNLPYKNYVKIGFIGGYNQALEDNKEKKYTEDDLKKAICIAKDSMGVDNDGETCYSHLSTEQIIQSLQPQTEWEVEIVDGKLKLKS